MRDIYSGLLSRVSLAAAALAATTNGTGVDTLNCKAGMVVVSVGAITGAAVFGVTLQESADNATWNAVPADLVQSSAPAILLANSVARVGYLGSKRYFRPVFTLVSGTSALIAAIGIVEPLTRPIA